MFLLLVVAVIITIVVIFSIQNAVPVVITFFFWRFEASLAIVVFLSVVAGVLIAWIIAYLSSIRKYFRRKALAASEKYEGKDG
jgi:putative membrane protein